MEHKTLDLRAAAIKTSVLAAGGNHFVTANGIQVPAGQLSSDLVRQYALHDMKDYVRQLDALRKGSPDRRCVDIDLHMFIKEKFGFGSLDSFYAQLGIDPSTQTIDSLSSMSDMPEGYRWIIPEIIREAVRLGLRRNPIYRDLIAAEENITQPQITMPSINMSAADVSYVNEGETIPVGSVSFNKRQVSVRKMGTGFKTTDEVQRYVSLNLLMLYMQDAGVRLGLGFDTMAIDVLINGEQLDGSMSAPVVGVEDTGAGIQYTDIMYLWYRLGRLGRLPSAILTNEREAINISQFPEFKGGMYLVEKQTLNVRTPVPQVQDMYIHGAMPIGDKLGVISRSSALIKLNATGLMVESERIAEKQLTGTYATVTTGFVKLFRDGFVILDGTQNVSGQDFPSWMDVSTAENVVIS